ncbi:ribonuclease E/G [Cognatishimia sp. MH4019]|uniref:ribonuclease E/G n=1 Tax=Cognatishimia sp. MH4019 TaxID=2854030 RepID=UPI001CD1F5D7|nr:ribonuclease E/G [Cognatishimia sp. MH4019]
MKGRLIALDHIGDREAAALMVDGKLEDLIVAQASGPIPGSIYRAEVGRQMKGQGGVIVSLGDGHKGFLRGVNGAAPGDTLLVQVTGHAEAGKATPVTPKLLFKSRYAIVTPDAPGINISRAIRDDDIRDALLLTAHEVMDAGGYGLIVRSSAAEADADAIAEDIEAMRALAEDVLSQANGTPALIHAGDGPHLVAWREWTAPAQIETDAGCFEDHGVLDHIDTLARAHVGLPAGFTMFIEPTRALIAVDVNTGGDTSPAAGLKANMAAAKALPTQLRLRGLGGQITMDLAPMTKRDRKPFEVALRAAFKSDAVDTTLVGWTPLGHFELQRKRERVPLSEVLT